jgi:hypothetical protein
MFTFYTINARIEINEILGKWKNEYLVATKDFGPWGEGKYPFASQICH